jgi:hypothetical protein
MRDNQYKQTKHCYVVTFCSFCLKVSNEPNKTVWFVCSQTNFKQIYIFAYFLQISYGFMFWKTQMIGGPNLTSDGKSFLLKIIFIFFENFKNFSNYFTRRFWAFGSPNEFLAWTQPVVANLPSKLRIYTYIFF